MSASPHHDGERRQPVEGAAGIGVVLHRDPLQEAAEHQPLGECGDDRSADEGVVPPDVVGLGDPAELEGDAAEHQRQQHDDDGQVDRRHDDGVGQRERHPQAPAPQHQPGLVAVPEGRHRVHHHVAVLLLARKRKQDADAEVEAVEDDVHDHRKGDDEGPDDGKVQFHLSALGDQIRPFAARARQRPVGPARRAARRSAAAARAR
jgi:hypothetical protein